MTSLKSGVKMVLMKKLSLYVFLVLMWCNTAQALPECKGSDSSKWTKCNGKVTFYNGNIYEGEFYNGKGHGYGKYIWVSGSKYVGEWKDGQKHGQGTYTSANGDKYVGEFKDGKRYGQGTYTHNDGKIDKGIWENGELIEPN